MKIHFFIEDTHLPPNISKCISSHLLKTRIYPQIFPNASAVTWSLVLQTRNLANKIEEFQKCDDFSGEISQLTYTKRCRKWIFAKYKELDG
jgi:hypothetical protein